MRATWSKPLRLAPRNTLRAAKPTDGRVSACINGYGRSGVHDLLSASRRHFRFHQRGEMTGSNASLYRPDSEDARSPVRLGSLRRLVPACKRSGEYRVTLFANAVPMPAGPDWVA